jgi:anti-sigma factor RsiW
MRFFRRHRGLVCRQAVALVTDYLDGTLSDADRDRFEVHIADCPHCRTYLEQIRTTIALTGQVAPEELDDAVQAELISLYRRWRADSAR